MLQSFRTNQNKFVVPDFLNTVSNNPPDSGTMFDEIQFKFLVSVQRICEFRLMPFDDEETILFGQLCNFCKY